jgi:glucokinase
MPDQWRLLADIGGTNIRFGLARERHSGEATNISHVQSWPVGTFGDFEGAVRAYCATLDDDLRFSSAAIAAAGPATPECIRLTNNDWIITIAGLTRTLGYDIPVRLLNDLEAVAYALPYLPESGLDWWDTIRPPRPPTGRRLAINVGTGFGSAAIIDAHGTWVCCPAESGHMHLGCSNARELALLAALGQENTTVEDILSGDGAHRLWHAIAAASGPIDARPSDPVHALDFADTDPATNETRNVFSTYLARAAANLVLASAAWDGVYLCGSVALAWSEKADRGAFRQTFAAIPKMHDRLANTPIGLIRDPFPAFVGLASLHMS